MPATVAESRTAAETLQAGLPDGVRHSAQDKAPRHEWWMSRFAQHYRAAEVFMAYSLVVGAAEDKSADVFPVTHFNAARFLLLQLLQVGGEPAMLLSPTCLQPGATVVVITEIMRQETPSAWGMIVFCLTPQQVQQEGRACLISCFTRTTLLEAKTCPQRRCSMRGSSRRPASRGRSSYGRWQRRRSSWGPAVWRASLGASCAPWTSLTSGGYSQTSVFYTQDWGSFCNTGQDLQGP